MAVLTEVLTGTTSWGPPDTVTGGSGSDYTLVRPTGGPVPLVTVSGTLTGTGGNTSPSSGYSVAGTYLAGGASEVQILTSDPSTASGNFTVSGPIGTQSVVHNASALTLATELNTAWQGILPDFAVSGSSGGPDTIMFGDEGPWPLAKIGVGAGTLVRNLSVSVSELAIGGLENLYWNPTAGAQQQIDQWTITAGDPNTVYTASVNGKQVSITGIATGPSAIATVPAAAWTAAAATPRW